MKNLIKIDEGIYRDDAGVTYFECADCGKPIRTELLNFGDDGEGKCDMCDD